MDSRRAIVVLVIACLAYIVAILQRTSVGVVGVEATTRFSIDATALSSLAVLQLGVYALLQIPVGVLIDRFGPRVLIAAGALAMALGQASVAIASDLGVAVLGRVLVGAGDAMTFLSVLRLLGAWFSLRRLPQLQQWVGTLGQSGQLLSAVPFVALLGVAGWTSAFLSAASLSLLAAVLVVAAVRDAPADHVDERALTLRIALVRLAEALRRPGTRLGFWAHAVSQSSPTMFVLLWGYPFLSVGLGYDAALTGALLGLIVVAGAAAGPVIGLLSARFPLRRSSIVLGIVMVTALAWAALLLPESPPPLPAVILFLMVLAVGGPGSLIGFDFARTFNPTASHGAATGFVNVGGFVTTVILVLAVGLALDAVSGGTTPAELYAWQNWRFAFAVQYPIIGLAVIGLIVARRRTRRRLAEEEGIAVAPLWRALIARWRARGWRGGGAPD